MEIKYILMIVVAITLSMFLLLSIIAVIKGKTTIKDLLTLMEKYATTIEKLNIKLDNKNKHDSLVTTNKIAHKKGTNND